MRSIWMTSSIAVLTLVLGAPANAADLRRAPLPPMPPPPAPPPLLQSAPALVDEFASGWYLRGDIGYRMNKLGSSSNAGADPIISDDLGKSWVAGFGVGYKLSWFRADLTLDYGSKAKYTGDTALAADDFTAKIDSVTGLANVYGDLGTWYGLTPYIGAGVGFAHLRVSDFSQTTFDTSAGASSKWNFAWAVMAGLSYKISGNYHIDLGYRHLGLGSVNSNTDELGNQVAFKKLSADEIRLGFRYVID